MLHCQQHLSKLVAAAPRDGEITLPMFTQMSNIDQKAKAAAAAWLDSGLEKPGSRPSDRSAPALMMSSNNVRVQR